MTDREEEAADAADFPEADGHRPIVRAADGAMEEAAGNSGNRADWYAFGQENAEVTRLGAVYFCL